ncbi:hypothetical protein K474DRAFT_1679867 [Panus rudis PR-1116 ss-1]|nr:hypothetical protein K474DRAFT_1679867 [Panus rudis PR-1116 ss-1]
MTLEDGTYIISCDLGDGAKYIRYDDKGDSVRPDKRVVTLPGGVKAPEWKIKKVDNGYIVSIDGMKTGERDGYLFTDVPDEDVEKWNIEEVPQHGKDIYIINITRRERGWVFPTDAEPYQQLLVRPLIVFPTFPPRYPAHELFSIVPVKND